MDPQSLRMVTKVVRLTAAAECDERAGQMQRASTARSEASLLIANLLPLVVAHPSGQGPAGNGVVLFLLCLLVENGHSGAARGGQMWRKKDDRLATLLLVPLYTFAALSSTFRTSRTEPLSQIREDTRKRLATQFLIGQNRVVTTQLLEEMKMSVGVAQAGGPTTSETGNYQIINDIDSMERIVSYVALALRHDPQVADVGLLTKYAIERAVQVAGEYLKNTRASPNLSIERREALLRDHVPTAKLSELRDSMSHATTLMCVTRRLVEETSDESGRLFRDLQWDLRKVSKVLTKAIHALRIRLMTMFASALRARPEYQPLRPDAPAAPRNDQDTATAAITETGTLITALDYLQANNWSRFLHTMLHVESERGLPSPLGALAVTMRNTATIVEFLENGGREDTVNRPWLRSQVESKVESKVEVTEVTEKESKTEPEKNMKKSTESAEISESVTSSVLSSCVAFTDLDDRLSTPVAAIVATEDSNTTPATPAQLHDSFVQRLMKASEASNLSVESVQATLLVQRTRFEARTSLLSRRDDDVTEWATYEEFLRLVQQARRRVVSLREVRQLSKAFGFASGQPRVSFEGAFATYRDEAEQRSRAAVVDAILSDTLARLEQNVGAAAALSLQRAVDDSRSSQHYRQLVDAVGQNERDLLGRTAFSHFIDSLPGLDTVGRKRLYDAFDQLQSDALRRYYVNEMETLRGVLHLDSATLAAFVHGERGWAKAFVERAADDPVLQVGLEMLLLNLLSILKDMAWQDERAYRATERLIKRAVSTLDTECGFGEHVPLRNYLAHGDWLLESLNGERLPRLLAWTAIVLATEGDAVITLQTLVRSHQPTGGISVPDQVRRSPFWMGAGATWPNDLAELRLPSWRPNEAQDMAHVYADAGHRLWQRSLVDAATVPSSDEPRQRNKDDTPPISNKPSDTIDLSTHGGKH